MEFTPKMMQDFKESIMAWEGDPKDKAMAKTYAKDRKDLREIYKYIMRGEHQKAYEKTYWLDTVVRDQVPIEVYNILFDKFDK